MRVHAISRSKWEYKKKDDVDIGGTSFRPLWLTLESKRSLSDTEVSGTQWHGAVCWFPVTPQMENGKERTLGVKMRFQLEDSYFVQVEMMVT